MSARILSVLLLAGCSWQVRGATPGYTFSPISKFLSLGSHLPSLSRAGARVTVLSTAPACAPIAEVTGTAGPAPDALLGEPPEQLEARLPWKTAIDEARNRAASAGATTIVIDAVGILDHHTRWPHGVYAAAYGRAFPCR